MREKLMCLLYSNYVGVIIHEGATRIMVTCSNSSMLTIPQLEDKMKALAYTIGWHSTSNSQFLPTPGQI